MTLTFNSIHILDYFQKSNKKPRTSFKFLAGCFALFSFVCWLSSSVFWSLLSSKQYLRAIALLWLLCWMSTGKMESNACQPWSQGRGWKGQEGTVIYINKPRAYFNTYYHIFFYLLSLNHNPVSAWSLLQENNKRLINKSLQVSL